MRDKAKEDYKPEMNGPGLTQSTLTASACVRLYNYFENACFSYVLALEKKNGCD